MERYDWNMREEIEKNVVFILFYGRIIYMFAWQKWDFKRWTQEIMVIFFSF